jgi:hypothetical protein
VHPFPLDTEKQTLTPCFVGVNRFAPLAALSEDHVYSKVPRMTNTLTHIERAMNLITEEMFKKGPEEGNRLWSDVNHPLHKAIRTLLQAKLELKSEEATALLEEHRRQEESSSTG